MINISNSVGAAGQNKPIDVMLVQHLLNLNYDLADFKAPITGLVDEAMIQAIKRFQKNALGSKQPDGRVNPGKSTLAKLAAPELRWIVNAPAVRARMIADLNVRTTYELLRSVVGASDRAQVATRPGEASSSLSIIKEGAFLKLYDQQFGILGASQRAGFAKIIGYINQDTEIWDIGWCAYMLATVKRECGGAWQPVPEGGRGNGHKYGQPDPYTDAEGKKYANIYYGRGYVQLTWKDNYLSLGQALGFGDDLAKNPDLALDADIAYEIMSYGMRNGSFSRGEKLSKYINAITCDYRNARRIINGLDVCELIKGYALDLEMLLRVSCYGSFSDSPARAFVGIGSRPRAGQRR